MVRYVAVWWGMVWCSVVWCSIIWWGMVRLRYDMVQYGAVWYSSFAVASCSNEKWPVTALCRREQPSMPPMGWWWYQYISSVYIDINTDMNIISLWCIFVYWYIMSVSIDINLLFIISINIIEYISICLKFEEYKMVRMKQSDNDVAAMQWISCWRYEKFKLSIKYHNMQ